MGFATSPVGDPSPVLLRSCQAQPAGVSARETARGTRFHSFPPLLQYVLRDRDGLADRGFLPVGADGGRPQLSPLLSLLCAAGVRFERVCAKRVKGKKKMVLCGVTEKGFRL